MSTALVNPAMESLAALGVIVDPGLPYDPANGHPGFEVHGQMVAVSPLALHRIPRSHAQESPRNRQGTPAAAAR